MSNLLLLLQIMLFSPDVAAVSLSKCQTERHDGVAQSKLASRIGQCGY